MINVLDIVSVLGTGLDVEEPPQQVSTMLDMLDIVSLFGSGSVAVDPEPQPAIRRPRMRMVKFSPTMYDDDVTFYRATKLTSGQGGTKNDYPNDGIPMVANVMSRRVDRVTAGGRTTSVTIHMVSTPSDIRAKVDDKFEWEGRTLMVEAGTIPKGTGNVTFHTPCVESK